MAQFSGAVKIGDLNDFIAPSQACVVSLNGKPKDAGQQGEKELVEEGQVQIKKKGIVGQQSSSATPEEGPVQISLHDCLACSGCITSAETVLLQDQSTRQLLNITGDPDKVIIISISPQSRASLAALYGISATSAMRKLSTFFKWHLSAMYVLDVGLGRDIALMETAHEFLERYLHSRQCGPSGRPLEHTATNAQSAARSTSFSPAPQLPMLASACPGWICYAEKTHGDLVLPYISTTKSPQAIMGTLVKQHLCGALGLDPDKVYHCTVMPCYDKKLEASRDDFLVPGSKVPEVDCCLTTGEVHDLITHQGIDFMSLAESSWDTLTSTGAAGGREETPSSHTRGSDGVQPNEGKPEVTGGGVSSQGHCTASASSAHAAVNGYSSANSNCHVEETPIQHQRPVIGAEVCDKLYGLPGSSGGYMEYVFRIAAEQLYGIRLPKERLRTISVRNNDFQEVVLEGDPGQPQLKFALAYGFRNIQTLIRKIKTRRCDYDYVEIMACPGGCLNGAGQLKPQAGQSPSQLLDQLERVYHDEDLEYRVPEDNPALRGVYQCWLQGQADHNPGRISSLWHTGYHKREKTVTSAIADW